VQDEFQNNSQESKSSTVWQSSKAYWTTIASLERIVTLNEAWIYHYFPESKWKDMKWKKSDIASQQ
jgi:hypothetical protein